MMFINKVILDICEYRHKGNISATITIRKRQDNDLDILDDYGSVIRTISTAHELKSVIEDLEYIE